MKIKTEFRDSTGLGLVSPFENIDAEQPLLRFVDKAYGRIMTYSPDIIMKLTAEIDGDAVSFAAEARMRGQT